MPPAGTQDMARKKTVDTGGNVVPYTAATAATTGTSTWGGIPGSGAGNGTTNYDLSLTTPANAGTLRHINTLRYIGGAATQNGATANALLLKVNCILNAGTGTLTIGAPGGAAGMGISSSSSAHELILAAANAGITFGSFSVITNNGANATAVTVTGPNTVSFFGTNTYSGNTTIGAGTLALGGNGSIANTPSITLFSGATLDVTGLNTALTLGSGQTLQASATVANTTARIAVAAGKNLTLGGTTTGLAFTAYGGGSAPLTVTGTSAGSLDLNGKPVTVTTTTALPAGAYKLVGKAGLATVTNTPGTLTVNGSGVTPGGTASLRVTAGELYLDVVTTIATTTTVTRSAGTSPSTYGSTLTFKATVVPASGAVVPTGTVQFKTNGMSFGSPVTVSADTNAPNGKAEIDASLLPYDASAYTVTASYTASGGFTGSSDNTGISQTIDKATPTATLAVTNSPETYDGSAKSATVVTNASSVPGTVANIQLDGGANSKTAAGVYAATADFVPTDTANYNTLAGLSAGSFVIQKATPTATLAVNNSPVVYDGNPHAATVGISASSTAGSVANILTGGAATQTDVGSYAVTADFVPTDSANYNSLPGLSAGAFVINRAATTITITQAGNTATINVSGNPTNTYILQTSTNLSGSWWPIDTNTANTSGVLIFIDSNATNTQQFYRTAH
jgi:hypothetical protein